MSNSMWGSEGTQHFYELSPDIILNSIEKLGYKTTGRCLTLNSMENRVFEIEIDDHENGDKPLYSVIAKFYRPGRWSKEQILEEHQFLQDLNNTDLQVNSPIDINHQTLFEVDDQKIYFSLFHKIGGRLESELNDKQIEKLGRILGRVHLVGKSKKAIHRIELGPKSYGQGSRLILQDNNSIPQLHKEHYLNQIDEVIAEITPLFQNVANQRIHGDCHQGNVIWSHEGNPLLVDFDDMVTAPIIQDCWLLFDWQDNVKKDIFIDAYEEFNEFPYPQIKLIEPLRTLRMIHFNAWISKRWSDPSFQQAFPLFLSEEYWSQQIADIRNQLILLKQTQEFSIF